MNDFRERGMSLVLTLILLVVVGILSTALIRSSVHNLEFSRNELDRKRAFYAAEAGIEELQIRMNEFIDFKEDGSINYKDLDNELLFTEDSYLYNQKEQGTYEVKHVNELTFKSTGEFNNTSESIYIDLYGLNEIIQIKGDDNNWEEYLKGAMVKNMYEDGLIKITEIEPPEHFWFGYYDYDENDFDTKLPDKNYYGLKETEEPDEFEQDGNEYVFSGSKIDDFYYEDGDNYEDYFKEDLDLEVYDKEEFDKNDHVGYEETYSKFENDDGEIEYYIVYNKNSDFTAFIDGGVELGKTGGGAGGDPGEEYKKNIINTILVVDGDVTINPQLRIYNSIIILRDGSLKFTGGPTEHIKDSLFYVYGDHTEEEDIQVAGQYKDWDIGGFPDFDEDIYDVEKYSKVIITENWRVDR